MSKDEIFKETDMTTPHEEIRPKSYDPTPEAKRVLAEPMPVDRWNNADWLNYKRNVRLPPPMTPEQLEALKPKRDQ